MEKYGERYYIMAQIYKQNYMGQAGFIWWVGVVESRKDPLNLGRCQVRIFGWHTENLQLIPTADLPWAHPVIPVNESDTTKTPTEGQYVMGFFFDGESGQFPAYLGVIPGIPDTKPFQGKGFSDARTKNDLQNSPQPFGGSASLYPNQLNEPTTSRLFRNENIDKTIIQRERDAVVESVPAADGSSWSQPSPSYATVPPFNSVKETESGHVMEFDDTKDAERVHVAHRTGTYTEMRPDGSKVTKVVKDNYELIAGNDYVNIVGNCNITVNGNANLYIKGNVNELIDGNVNKTVKGSVNETVSGSYNLQVSGSVVVQGSTINLN